MKTILKEINGIEPLTPERLANYLRIDDFDKNEMIALIKQARENVESYTGIDFVMKTYNLYFNALVDKFVVPFQNVQEMKSVFLNKTDGTSEEITSLFKFYKASQLVVQKESVDTSLMEEYDGIVFEFLVGVSTDKIPEKIIGAIQWWAVNTYFKIQPTEWYDAFKNLLRDARVVKV